MRIFKAYVRNLYASSRQNENVANVANVKCKMEMEMDRVAWRLVNDNACP